MKRIFIVMATYNGAKYLEQQLLSIQEQSLVNWQLVIRDDGSNDNTVDILKKFSEDDSRITLLENPSNRKNSPANNFGILLEHVASHEPDYIFLSDQDDVWLPNKLQLFIKFAESLSEESKQPLLVHSDLRVVDKNLSVINKSFVASQYLPFTNENLLETLLVQNCVTGCATMINGYLLKEVLPIHESSIMHDWWLALIASVKGNIIVLEQPTVLYRQHSTNNIGAKSILNNMFSLFGNESYRHTSRVYLQAKALKKHFDKQGYKNKKLENFLSICKQNSRIKRLCLMLQYGFKPKGKLHFSAFCVRQILSPKSL